MFAPLLTRRGLGLLALALALPALPRGAAAQMDTGRAIAFIRAAGDELVAAINQPGLSAAARQERVAAVLRRTVDIEGVGRFVLGRFWRVAAPTEQQEYLRLFEASLIRNLAGRFGEYQGVRFSLGRTQSRTEDDALVSTVVQRPGQTAFNLDWRVGDVGGHPRIVDLIAEGTSLRLTQRSEYASVVQRGSGQVSALLVAMRAQTGR
ncbi:MAG: ABC transporter substrate-binding protein [Rubritepida sp.]|nr:ABC transporter substrate-binding protein [Rubritepida sp.]